MTSLCIGHFGPMGSFVRAAHSWRHQEPGESGWLPVTLISRFAVAANYKFNWTARLEQLELEGFVKVEATETFQLILLGPGKRSHELEIE